VYAISRLMVAAAAGLVAGAFAYKDTTIGIAKPKSAAGLMLDVLTSWDGNWYFELIRHGYPRSVPHPIDYFQPEARAAFFPLYPLLVRGVNRVLPGSDVSSALFVNLLLGAVVVVLVGLIARRLAGSKVAARAMVLTCVFPGSFVLSFAYSEALMLALAAGCLLALLDRRWLLAGVLAALASATRPNALALAVACLVAAIIAWRADRDRKAFIAPALAPIGFIVFQWYVGHHAGERGVWFRVQREAWGERASFGGTVLRGTFRFLLHPFHSAPNAITALCFVATIIGLVLMSKAKLPAPINAYTITIVVLMLSTATVTARPRFLFTAFPFLIATAKVWREDEHEWWAIVLAVCAAGLVTVTGLYGGIAAIP
jgi:hypothetical protein